MKTVTFTRPAIMHRFGPGDYRFVRLASRWIVRANSPFMWMLNGVLKRAA